jgi:hypothetical protein
MGDDAGIFIYSTLNIVTLKGMSLYFRMHWPRLLKHVF